MAALTEARTMDVPQKPADPGEHLRFGAIAKRAVTSGETEVECAGCGEEIDATSFHLLAKLRRAAGGGHPAQWTSFCFHDSERFDGWRRDFDA
ncbi:MULTISPECIES: hypothetical protein [Halobacterium]|uniref:hypothetical protein n=1 Tax=Halobacterium TaxID=2239 RepID=UPI0012F8A585|nr:MULTISPECIES: hypothetical protein [Halobacterium]MCG1004911.1 hypothetical protein [Halobacterium noricense]